MNNDVDGDVRWVELRQLMKSVVRLFIGHRQTVTDQVVSVRIGVDMYAARHSARVHTYTNHAFTSSQLVYLRLSNCTVSKKKETEMFFFVMSLIKLGQL